MKPKFGIIINILIIFLIIVLAFVMMNYYAKGLSVVPANQENTQTPESGNEEKIINISQQPNNNSGDEIIISGDEQSSTNTKQEDGSNNNSENVSKLPSSPVIMTSENEISSTEKQQILGELDKTLMELLDVVDKVQTIDETRLPQDSEVQS